ncbi:uS10/mL48 family ribosomal protein [Candidatus Carsonella ruddii]|uniref:Ribosomal protein S10 n=2 Tax=Carsonella ruddii TaxID=114186 RepID=Q9AIN9_CARRU|nr:uS10/mL48 family ribosomal protein [Candidatus Carsonella ruddii]AAK18636.1 ribosomal protein S10 [Candidatus Carsonella ruddii]AFP83639.1 ribosomal protein S10 [Candidatus Carsonella ruddii CE isolate Thao2000]
MIKIILKSFFINEINSFLLYFLKNIKKKYNYIGPFYTPKKIEKFTLLVSPFIDKNSRDQLQIKRYKSFFYIKNYDILFLNFIIKNRNINGVDINFFFL